MITNINDLRKVPTFEEVFEADEELGYWPSSDKIGSKYILLKESKTWNGGEEYPMGSVLTLAGLMIHQNPIRHKITMFKFPDGSYRQVNFEEVQEVIDND